MASATLTWHVSALGTKTNTTLAAFFGDFNTLIVANAGDANFKWEVASVYSAGTPYYLVLKRKDASAGRILIVSWSSAPAANNAAILDSTPTNNIIHSAWFPAGSADTPSNLTAASGTILGDDTGVVKCTPMGTYSTIYTTNYLPFYADCEDGVLLCTGTTAATATYMCGAGKLVVSTADEEQDCSIGANGSIASFSNTTVGPFNWVATAVSAGLTATCIRTNYGVANTPYFVAFMPNGDWGATAVGGTDVLSDTTINEAWFVPVPLISKIKGGGFPLQLRQIAFGPATTGPLQVYNTTGPVTAAVQLCQATTGAASHPWVTNFKV